MPGWNLGAALFAFADDKVPNEAARELSPQVGWVMLLGVLALCLLFILHSERWRRWWLTVEDPRSIGLYRIVFGFFVVCNVNDFFEYFTFLFTDEGIFTADVARQVHAPAQFKGFGDGFSEEEPWGFFDVWGVIEFLKGPKWSLLYFWDSPTAFWIHMVAFYAVGTSFMLGFRSRVSGVLTFLLMNSIFFRNHLFWEGTELVYRVFLAYLLCAKSGHAYSIDNWLRCRKLRKRGLLSERDGPGGGAGAPPSDEHPKGLAAIYRGIPAWPRRLMVLQLCTVYAFTGIVKNGSVWAKGDAIYYAWNMDHFYRFYPQKISAIFGTNIMRLMTWMAHWGEAFFWISIIGIFVFWGRSEMVPASTGVRRTLTRLSWGTLLLVSGALVWVTWPVHFTPVVSWPAIAIAIGVIFGVIALYNALAYGIARATCAPTRSLLLGVIVPLLVIGACGGLGAATYKLATFGQDQSAAIFCAAWVSLLGAIWWMWERLDRKPLVVAPEQAAATIAVAIVMFGVAIIGLLFAANIFAWRNWTILAIVWLVLAPASLWLLRKRKPLVWARMRSFGTTQIDKLWVCRWIVGRRIWITWHIAVMGGIFTLMNIGQFQTGMLSQTFILITGIETALFLRFSGRLLAKVGVPMPADVRAGLPPIPPEDPTLPHLHRDAVRLPQWALFATFAIVLAGVLVAAVVQPQWNWLRIWYAALLFIAGVAFQRWRTQRGRKLPEINPETGGPRTPWAYGPFGRFVVGGMIIWHLVAVLTWLLPEKDSMFAFRGEARKIFAMYLTRTQTDQGWGMFAPNPPRSNVFLKVLVTDQDGEAWDMRTDVYAPERKPIPWIWNDRMRKMNRRIIGGESGDTSWYRKWHARYYCRQWALEHDGVPPKKVDLIKVWYKIPSPEEVARKGYYVPEELLERTREEKVEYTEHCKNAVMGQLPNFVRERHGLDPLPENEKYKAWIKHKKKAWEKAQKKQEEEAAKAAAEKDVDTEAQTQQEAKLGD
jgi:Vitamin K-dependent gamma-carboxylase